MGDVLVEEPQVDDCMHPVAGRRDANDAPRGTVASGVEVGECAGDDRALHAAGGLVYVAVPVSAGDARILVPVAQPVRFRYVSVTTLSTGN